MSVASTRGPDVLLSLPSVALPTGTSERNGGVREVAIEPLARGGFSPFRPSDDDRPPSVLSTVLSSKLLQPSSPLRCRKKGLSAPKKDAKSVATTSAGSSTDISATEDVIDDSEVEGPSSCPFPDCTAGPFNRRSVSLSLHLRREHPGSKPFQCTQPSCDKKFFTMTELRLHKVSHGDQKPFLCPIEGCTKGFSDRSGLRYHKKAAHSDVSTFAFKCLYPDCGKSFIRRQSYVKHIRCHEDTATWSAASAIAAAYAQETTATMSGSTEDGALALEDTHEAPIGRSEAGSLLPVDTLNGLPALPKRQRTDGGTHRAPYSASGGLPTAPLELQGAATVTAVPMTPVRPPLSLQQQQIMWSHIAGFNALMMMGQLQGLNPGGVANASSADMARLLAQSGTAAAAAPNTYSGPREPSRGSDSPWPQQLSLSPECLGGRFHSPEPHYDLDSLFPPFS